VEKSEILGFFIMSWIPTG